MRAAVRPFASSGGVVVRRLHASERAERCGAELATRSDGEVYHNSGNDRTAAVAAAKREVVVVGSPAPPLEAVAAALAPATKTPPSPSLTTASASGIRKLGTIPLRDTLEPARSTTWQSALTASSS
mmetsp:Transcript_15742/g.36416  ORF Transcript_15742/g.36416 Transcript_15742/m.36416 type:complete len:126 (-) Transcript_15742:1235-1612(-)